METFDKGTKTAYNSICIVDLHGTWKEMGRQYGYFLKKELGDVFDFVMNIANANETNRYTAKSITDRLERQHPYFITSFFSGMSETSGFSKEELLYIEGIERISGLPACSGIAVCGEYSSDGKLVFGRNYDYGKCFKTLNKDVVVAVFHPADGSIPVAIIGYAGEIYCTSGLNAKGVFVELNNGSPSSPYIDERRIYGTTMLFSAMFQTETLDDLDVFFHSVSSDYAYIISVADKTEACSYEWDVNGVKYGDRTKSGRPLIATNHFVDPSWPYPLPTNESSWDSFTRRGNLASICRDQKGAIDAEKMMDILDMPLEAGGATDEYTVYQMVVIPEDMTVWLKSIGATPWIKLDMGKWLTA